MGLMSVMADIWRSRSRSALTMSAVAIGIFSVTVISAAGQIGTAKINDSLDDMGVNSVLVEAQEAGVALSDSDIDALGGLSGVNFSGRYAAHDHFSFVCSFSLSLMIAS